jgi:hypothetical protein
MKVKLLEEFNAEHINEASYGQNYIFEIATPAPTSTLVKELKALFGNDLITTNWKSPEGFESVAMLNLTPADIKKIKSEIGDVLVFRMEITNRHEM